MKNKSTIMKQRLEKIFYISGNGIDKTYTQKYENYWLTPEKLGNHAEVIQIGNHKEGFEIEELYRIFHEHIDEVNDNYLNIILRGHGGQDLDNEIIIDTAEGKSVSGKFFVEVLRSATKGIPLKLLVTFCEGELLQNSLNMLPKGSMLITLGNINTSVNSSDMYNLNSDKLLEIISSNGVFKFENLLNLYCLKTDNDPVIGIHDNFGRLYKSKVSDFISIKPDYDYSITKRLFSYLNVDLSYIDNLLSSAMEWKPDAFKPLDNKDIIHAIIDSITKGTFVKEIETSYSLQFYDLSHRVNPKNVKSKILEKMTEKVRDFEKLESLWESVTEGKLRALEINLSELYEQIDPELEIIKNNLMSKLNSRVFIADEKGNCNLADENFKKLFQNELDEFLIELGLPIYFIEQKLKDLKSKDIIQQDSFLYEDGLKVDLYVGALKSLNYECKIIETSGLYDHYSPEVIRDYNILLPIAAENGIHLAEEILNVYPSLYQIVMQTQLIGEPHFNLPEM